MYSKKYFTFEEVSKDEKLSEMLEKSQKKQKRKDKAVKNLVIACFIVAIALIICYYVYRSVRAYYQLKIIAGDFISAPLRTIIIILISVIVTLLLYKAKNSTEEKYKKLRKEKANGKNSDENSAR